MDLVHVEFPMVELQGAIMEEWEEIVYVRHDV